MKMAIDADSHNAPDCRKNACQIRHIEARPDESTDENSVEYCRTVVRIRPSLAGAFARGLRAIVLFGQL
jgi:hypothetical protein